MTRSDGRAADALRPVSLELGIQRHPAGSVLVGFGGTRVICAATYDDRAPRWRNRTGWVTSEYAMLPGATDERARRQRQGAGGRAREIERLIARSLRAAVAIDDLPDCTITVDCDVLEADGGTRTAAVTGGWVALAVALERLGLSTRLRRQVSAVSVGVVEDEARLDLPYEEDVRAEVDMNVVATGGGDLVEVQGTAEGRPFSRKRLDELVDLALAGCSELCALQQAALEEAGVA